jgi:phage terminase small subunit
MPRKSAAALSVMAVDGKPKRLQPPEFLSDSERKLFVDLVASCDATHFRPSDLPLLCRYCEAAVLAERAAQELRLSTIADGKLSPWITVQEKAVRAMVALSMRLRLSPQSRIDPKTVSRRQAHTGRRPWEIRGE